MDSSDLGTLNRRFAIPGRLAFKGGPGGLTVAEIANDHAEATIALQGAHVMTYQPVGQQPVLWLSRHARFAPGKSIRGGVPVCWPWFGPHPLDPAKPAHGFARTVPWEVLETATGGDGSTTMRMGLIESEATRALWPFPCTVQARITVGPELRVELATRNLGAAPMALGEALHTYFRIGDVSDTAILGLEGCDYLDKADGFARKTQRGPVVIDGEVDRIYLNTGADCLIEDRGLNRRIRIAKHGSRSTVVWNPGVEKAEKMGDFGPQGQRGMVCVETANAAENAVSLPPGGEHRLLAVIAVEPLG